MPDTTPVEIRRVDDREIRVTWSDGHLSVFPNKTLRERCPCAGCVHEPRTCPVTAPSAA